MHCLHCITSGWCSAIVCASYCEPGFKLFVAIYINFTWSKFIFDKLGVNELRTSWWNRNESVWNNVRNDWSIIMVCFHFQSVSSDVYHGSVQEELPIEGGRNKPNILKLQKWALSPYHHAACTTVHGDVMVIAVFMYCSGGGTGGQGGQPTPLKLKRGAVTP